MIICSTLPNPAAQILWIQPNMWVTPLPLACEVHNILQVRSFIFDSFFFHAVKHEHLSIDSYGQIGYVFVPCVWKSDFQLCVYIKKNV